MKKSISLVTIFFSLFLITSCSGFFSNKSYEEAGKYIISGSVETEDFGAIPEELLNQTEYSRSAVPEVGAGPFEYIISAYLKSDAAKTVKASSTSSDGTFSLKLNKADVYILDCTVKYNSTTYFAGTKELELTAEDSYKTGIVINACVTSEIIDTFFASGATGDINLTFTADSDTGATTLKTYIDGTAQADITGTTSGSLTTFVLNVTGFTIGRKSHILKIEFYDAAGSLIYSCSDSLTVCKDLETNTWAEYNTKNPSPFLTYNSSSKKYEFLLTKTLTDGFKTTVFYVDGDIGLDSNSGLFDKPFATVQKAVEAVKEVNDGESEYTIYLLSDVTSSASSDFSSDYNSAFVDIGTSKPLKLIITSYGADAEGNPNCFKIDAGRTYDTNNTTGTQGRVISVGGQYLQNGTGSALSSKSIQLTLDSVEITGGRIEGEGAGIIVANNGTLIINNAIIKNNKCFGTSAQGGGVYLKGFSGSSDSNKLPVMIINSGKITENTTEKDGSGISVYYGASLTMNGGEICNNTTIPSEAVTTITGALLVNSGNLIINGGSISNNSCDCTDNDADINGVGLSVKDYPSLQASVNIPGSKSTVEICNNYIEDGEETVNGVGLYLSTVGTGNSFYFNNLLVSGNIGTGDECYGAGIYTEAELAMENVTISANKNATTGTGLYAGKNVSAYKNVQIINNIYDLSSGSVDGCGLYIASGSNFNFYDGIIAGNKCTDAGVTVKGEGVQVDGTFTMYDFAKVDESNDVYLASGKNITIGNELKNVGYVATITCSSPADDVFVLANASGSTTLVSKYYEKFNYSNDSYSVNNEGKLKSAARLYISGSTGNDESGNGSLAAPYKTFYKAMNCDKIKTVALAYIYVIDTVEESEKSSINSYYGITSSLDVYVSPYQWNGSDDTQPSINVSGVPLLSFGDFSDSNINYSITFTDIILDGVDRDVKNSGWGGLVYMNATNKKVTINGKSKIRNFKANMGGGVIYLNNSTSELILEGETEIYNNTMDKQYSGPSCGGAIYFNNGTLTIKDNVKLHGNNVINSNSSDESNYGGAIYQGGGTLNISDNVQIYSNSVINGYGGGLSFLDGSCSIGGNVRIYDNTITNGTGAQIYISSGTITIGGIEQTTSIEDSINNP